MSIRRLATVVALTLAVVMTASTLALAQSAAPKGPQQFQIRKAEGPIDINGVLDEPAWQKATAIPVRWEIFPGINIPAGEETVALVTYDERHFYIGFRAMDRNPSAIRANLADRDAPFLDDTVGFMIDTFNDGRRAFQFRINARGVQMDAFNSDVDGSEDWSWDAIWDAETRINTDGYIVEVAVPFSSLRFQRATGVQTWGFMAMRDIPRSTRHRNRSMFSDPDRACLICQFDKLTGIEGVTAGRNLEFDPTFTAARTDTRSPFPSGRLQAGDEQYEAGLSARWGITPNVILSGTVNPDFYQVEADSAQLDINTRFQLFFPEKRPFFLEGSDFFSTPLDLVFSRTVADPRWGVKLTGKEGPHAFGMSLAQDDVTGIMFPGYESSDFASLGTTYISNVFRYRRDVGTRGSTVGAIYAGREGDRYGNRVGGIDANVRLTNSDTIRVFGAASHTDYPQELREAGGQASAPIRGGAYAFRYSHGTSRWNWSANTSGLSPEFRADSGFLPQVGARFYNANLNRVFQGGAGKWYDQFVVGVSADRTEDWKGERVSWGCDATLEYTGRAQMGAYYTAACNYEHYLGRTYENFRHNFGMNIRPSGSLSFGVNATVGGAVDFDHGREAEQFRVSAFGAFNLFGRVAGEIDHAYQTLDVAGGRLFTANLTQGRLLYHLNLRTFVRAILQYTDIDRNTSNYLFQVAPESRRLFTQLLFNYKLNPQTVLLIGYSDNAQGTRAIDLTRANRTFFVKVGYAWVM